MKYAQLYEAAFHHSPDPTQGWIHFPFAWGTPEALQLQTTIWQIESQIWKQFLTNIREEKIEGDLVEFGVSAGNSLEQLISYAEEIELNINVWGFDSFEGLPEPSPHDPSDWEKGQFAAALEAVAERLKTESRPHVSLVKGWFSETLADPEIRRKIKHVTFARIDCDLYEPAVECLEFLEDRLVNGAYLCFDDWTDDPQTGETKAFFEFFERTQGKFTFEPLCRISLGGMHMRVRHA